MLHCVEDDGRSYYAENTDVADAIAHTGSWVRKVPPPGYADWRPDMDDPDHWVDGRYVPPLSRALDAMEDARPADAPPMEHLGEIGAVEAAQLDAFLDGEDEWWLMDGEGKCVDWPADDAEAGGVEVGDGEAGDADGEGREREDAVLAGRTG